MKLRRICETLPSSVRMVGRLSGSSKFEADRLIDEQRPQHAAQRAEQIDDLEFARPDFGLAGFDLGEVEEIVDQLGEVLGRLAEVPVHLLRRRIAALLEQGREREDRVHRRPELVRHVREEARLQLVGAPQVIGLLVQLGVERDDAAVGVLQLAVQPDQLLLTPIQLVERAQQLLILPLELFNQPDRLTIDDGAGDLFRAVAIDERSAARKKPLQVHRVPRGVDSSWKRSTRRRAPIRPMPKPVVDRYRPDITSSMSRMPLP